MACAERRVPRGERRLYLPSGSISQAWQLSPMWAQPFL